MMFKTPTPSLFTITCRLLRRTGASRSFRDYYRRWGRAATKGRFRRGDWIMRNAIGTGIREEVLEISIPKFATHLSAICVSTLQDMNCQWAILAQAGSTMFPLSANQFLEECATDNPICVRQ